MSGTQDAEDPLGEELRTLFADDRLDLHPAPQARASIVSGARRIRRRRTALSGGGAAVVIALVTSTVLLNNRTPAEDAPAAGSDTALAIESASPALTSTRTESGSTELAPPPNVADEPRTDSTVEVPGSTGVPSASTSPESSYQAVSGPVLGPDGYGSLRLGMSFTDAAATGELAVDAGTPPPAEGCGSYQLTEGDSAVREVVVSAEQGIVTFSASAATTPEGIGAGSRLEQVRQAYPQAARGSVTYSAPTGSGGSYVFYVADDQVDSMQLIASAVPC